MYVEHRTQVNDVDGIEAEILQVIVDRLRERFPGEGWIPGGVRAAGRPDLRDDDEVVLVWVQRFPDDLVGGMRAVEVAGVDVIDAALHGFA
ncbi:hypothetical protein D3C72_1520960 [compost metagenome]